MNCPLRTPTREKAGLRAIFRKVARSPDASPAEPSLPFPRSPARRHRPIRAVILILSALALASGSPACALEVKSPDGRVAVTLEVRDFEGAAACPVYTVSYRGRTVIAPSRL